MGVAILLKMFLPRCRGTVQWTVDSVQYRYHSIFDTYKPKNTFLPIVPVVDRRYRWVSYSRILAPLLLYNFYDRQ